MDISIKLDDYRLYVRSGCIIVHDNKILMHRNLVHNYYAIIGGKIAIGENSKETLKREMIEETGKEIEIIGYVTTVENFYEMDNEKYHEIMFIHKAEFVNEEDKKMTDTIINLENKNDQQYEWLDLDRIDEYNVKPKVLFKILKNREDVAHLVNYDV